MNIFQQNSHDADTVDLFTADSVYAASYVDSI